MDAILILQHSRNVKAQSEELLHVYNPFQTHEFWGDLQAVLKRHEEIEQTYIYSALGIKAGADAS